MRKENRFILFVLCSSFFLMSCNRATTSKSELLNALDLTLNVEMIDTVSQGEIRLAWTDFRIKYSNISVVYLQDGCAPCYPKFIEWHKRMDQIATADDYTVLFVINARDYTSFTRNINLHEAIEEKYYYFIDPRNMFFRANSGISRSVLDRSLMINSDNRVKMVIEPFANADITRVFHIVTGVESRKSVESSQ